MSGGSTIDYRIHIDDRLAGRTLKGILQSEFKFSTRLLRNGILRDRITKNGEPVYLNQPVCEGDEIYIMLPKEESELEPEPMSLDIRFEDEEIIVVNKPAGCLTHPTARERSGSILAGVYAYLRPQGLVPHSVHRLDRDTSGLIMFAKHAHSHHLFDLALRAGHLHRTYTAIVNHTDAFAVPDVGEWAIIDLPIAQDANKPSRRIISAAGQRAITHYRVFAQTKELSMVQVVLETGRTHQIRLHFSAIGMPLVGDKVYGWRPRETSSGANIHLKNAPPWQGFERQALHAHQLAWTHPVYKRDRGVEASPPDDMQNLWHHAGGADDAWKTLMADQPALRLGKLV
jgi:23S rRNA pseudouridine1911/1915/1917 synthase